MAVHDERVRPTQGRCDRKDQDVVPYERKRDPGNATDKDEDSTRRGREVGIENSEHKIGLTTEETPDFIGRE